MSASSIHKLIREYQLDPKKSLGQNFLADETHLDTIVAAANLAGDDTVLEVGPGLGTLTRRLAAHAGRVIAVELDDRLIDVLRKQFADHPHVSIHHTDILKTAIVPLLTNLQPPTSSLQSPISNLQSPPPYKVVANLPYYITSAVLRHLLEADHQPRAIVVMVQKEVAERICATPGNMSILAVSVQFYAEPRLVHRVPAGAFYPRPKVDSAVLHLAVRPTPAVPDVVTKRFFQIVRAGFSQKRKQLLNSLSGGLHLPKAAIQAQLAHAHIDPKRRAETLSLAEWGIIYHRLRPILDAANSR